MGRLAHGGGQASIPFEQIQRVAVAHAPSLLHEWFPAGKIVGREFRVGNLAGEPGQSMSVNLDTGLWADFAGDDRGHDLIDLRAALDHTDRVAAARVLADELGVTGNAGDTAHRSPPPTPAPVPPRENWQPIVPPPPGAPKPNPEEFARFSVTYDYVDAEDRLLFYVRRKEANGTHKKQFVPLTYGTLNGVTGWHKKHPLAPRPLYGLNRLATMPKAPVMVCEGEKPADAAQLLFPDHACVTWPGGKDQIEDADWDALNGRDDLKLWPDADPGGRKAMAWLQTRFPARTVRVDDLPLKADAADFAKFSSGAEPEAWLRERLPPVGPQPEPELNDAAAHAWQHPQQAEVIPLGHDAGLYFYLSRSAGQVVALTAAWHGKMGLLGLAAMEYWARAGFEKDKGGVDWDSAASAMMAECRDAGIFNPDRVRGRGVWIDRGRSVLHLGHQLVVDGTQTPIADFQTGFVYELANPMLAGKLDPLPTVEARKLGDISSKLRWKTGIEATLFSGFMATAPICGGLAWRPSIWITGGAGTGKTYVVEYVLAPALRGVALKVQSKTSEAGIRQTLGSDSRPVVFDEAEAEDQVAQQRMQGVLDLVRQSASEGGSAIIKGSPEGRARRFRIRSSFAFTSINVAVRARADSDRVTVLTLREAGIEDQGSAEAFEDLQRLVADTLTEDFAAGLVARSALLLPVIRKNAATFSLVVTLFRGSRREGDQLGALLAGAYSLYSDQVIAEAEAAAYVRQQDWGALDEYKTERDEIALLGRIMQHRIRIATGNGATYELTVGRLVEARQGNDDQIVAEVAERELRQLGILLDVQDGVRGLCVSNTHGGIGKMLAGTTWACGWSRVLARLPGAKHLPMTKNFGFNHRARAVWLPLDLE